MWYRLSAHNVEFEFHHYPDFRTSETLATCDGVMVGQMEFAWTDSGVVTTHAFLEPEYRGRGHGKAMYEFSWRKLKELGAGRVSSDVKVRTDARRVYESLGNDWSITDAHGGSHYSVDLTA